MFLVVLVLTALFLALYAYGTHAAFRDTRGFVGVNPERLLQGVADDRPDRAHDVSSPTASRYTSSSVEVRTETP